CTGLRSWSRRLLVGALASGARGGGACDSSLKGRRTISCAFWGRSSSVTGGGVTHNCGYADLLAGIAGEGHDSELDRDPCAILSNSRDRQDLAVSIARLPGTHG